MFPNKETGLVASKTFKLEIGIFWKGEENGDQADCRKCGADGPDSGLCRKFFSQDGAKG